MKKLFTLLLAGAFVSSVLAQTTIYTTNFAGSIGSWTTVDNSGVNAGVWMYDTNPIAAPSLGNSTFTSATASNGFMTFMSDAATDDGLAEDADLISPVINCSAHSYVFLQFDEYYFHGANSEGKVFVSNNGTNWVQVYDVASTTTNGQRITVDITAYAAGQATVQVKFNYQGNWDYFWSIDDVKLLVPVGLDISVDTIASVQYAGIGNLTVTGQITNRGGLAINSFDLSYTDNGGTPVFQSFSGLNIAPLTSYTYTFTQPIAMTTAIEHNLKVKSYSPNGGLDAITTNDSALRKTITLSALPVKHVLMEEFTTASCQYCTGALTRLNSIKARHPEFVIGQLHAGFGTDQMTTADHSTLAAQYTTSAPAVMVDRCYYSSEMGADIGFYTYIDRWEQYALERKTVTTPVSIKADNTYVPGSRLLTVNAEATFYSAITDNYRINCYIIEDSVTGSGSGYNQTNGYNTISYSRTATSGSAGQYTITISGGAVPLNFIATGTGIAPGAMVTAINGSVVTLSLANTGAVSGTITFESEWYGKGSPIVGYQHRYVIRYMFGGAWGATGVIPATTADGVAYTKQFTYTLPAGWDENQVTVAVLVQHYNSANKFDRQILNVIDMPLNGADSTGVNAIVTSVDEKNNSLLNGIKLFPNPTNDMVFIDFSTGKESTISMEVFDVMGQMVTDVPAAHLEPGDYTSEINTGNLNNGVYFVAVKDGNKVVQTLKFVVSR